MTNEQIARDSYRAINDRDWNALVAPTSDKCKFVDVPRGKTLSGKTCLKQDCEMWLKGFPDGKVQVTNLVSSGDWVIVEFIGKGTQTGELGSGSETIPPTNKKANLRFCDVLHFENGKISSLTTYYDQVTLMRQLGLMQPTVAKGAVEARPH